MKKRICLEVALYGEDWENENLVSGTTFWFEVKKVPKVGDIFDPYDFIPIELLDDPEIHDFIMDYEDCIVISVKKDSDEEGDFELVEVHNCTFY